MSNRIVVVTGATSGYGLAIAQKFNDNGDKVIIVSRDSQKVYSIVSQYGFEDGFCLDVTNYTGWIKLKEYVISKYGRIDILVNNAGGGVKIAEITMQDQESIDKAISLNLNSVIYGSSIFGEVFKSQRDGMIVNISSVCADHCWSGWSVYASAKAGVVNFTKGLYVDLQPYGVRATCIIPASASTGFQSSAGLSETSDSLRVDDIASAVLYSANLPKGAVVETMTVWGTSQVVNPL